MKSLAIILFIAAVISFVSGVFACCEKIKNKTIKNSGVWLIVTGCLKALCGLLALKDPVFAIIITITGVVLINCVKCLTDKKEM